MLVLMGGAFEWSLVGQLRHQVRLHRCAINWLHELRHARTMAMVQRRAVRLCVLGDSGKCFPPFSGGSSQLRLLATNRVIWRGGVLCPVSSTTWPARHIQFNALGETNGHQGRWVFSGRNGDNWQIILIHTGRLRLAHGHVRL